VLILGIDPGTIHVGYGFVQFDGGGRMRAAGSGTLHAPGKDFPARLRAIFEGLAAVLDGCRPDVVAVEEVFFAKNVNSAIKIGEGRAVAILCAALRGLPVVEYSPSEVKQAVAGNGQAHKTQVMQMVKALLTLPEVPATDHEADALAIAICHAHRARLPQEVRR